ncbi:hypothetical protein TNCV_1879921 [Trichonephila clavipes]|nr:hypothetical protein TNCV_1879921 [Trichonephila clavipes]
MRLSPQVVEFVEVQNLTSKAELLQMLEKYEDRHVYSEDGPVIEDCKIDECVEIEFGGYAIYIPILQHETFIKALWETRADKSFFFRQKKRPGNLNVIVDILLQNPVENTAELQITCAVIRYLVLSSREHLIEEQRKDPKLSHIYKYLQDPESGSINSTVCEN